MTDAVTVGLIAAVPATLLGVAGLITAWSTLAKVEVVKHATNSIATRDAGIIAAQAREIAMYREQLADLKQTALLLAQTKAVKALDTVTGQTVAAHDAWEKGEREKTAESIAENTALTREIRDAVVPKVEP